MLRKVLTRSLLTVARSNRAIQKTGVISAQRVNRGVGNHFVQRRHFSQEFGMWRGEPKLDIDRALNIVETINMYLESSNAQVRLNEIHTNTGQDLSVRWQSMLDVYFAVSLHVIVPFGFSGDQQGLQHYTASIGQALAGMQNTPEIKELQELSSESWALLLKSAFGVDLDGQQAISVEQVRAMAKAISQDMQGTDFLNEVESKVKNLPIEQKQPVLMSLLVPLQMKTTNANGFEGEEGYVLLQAEMMKNMADPEIQHNMAAAMTAVIRAADIPTQ